MPLQGPADRAVDLLVEHLHGPRVQDVVDDRERRGEPFDDLGHGPWMAQVVLPALIGELGPGRGLRARLVEDVAQPVEAHLGEVRERRPDGPPVRGGPQGQLLVGEWAHRLDQALLVLRPSVVEATDRHRSNSMRITTRRSVARATSWNPAASKMLRVPTWVSPQVISTPGSVIIG